MQRIISRKISISAISLIIISLLLFHPSLSTTRAQGGSGEGTTKPKPKPKPQPTHTQPARKAPASSRTRNGSRTNASNGRTGNDTVANERTFWESIRNSTDPEDFRAYLKKYPNGEFADLAKNKINNLVTAEVGYWESIKNSSNVDDFKTYLNKYPSGQFVEQAKNKIRSLEAASSTTTTTRTNASQPTRGQGQSYSENLSGVVSEMVYVPSGTFMMGSPSGVGDNDEHPQHQVNVQGFYMGKYEVTQAQYRAVMGTNPSHFTGCDECPVEEVSWNDAQEFIRRLNSMQSRYTYRLPSEAEWEYACRAGTTGDYAGNLDSMAWYSSNSGGRTHPVGQKQANGFGLYDMHGNVWEWCEDWYHDSYNGAPSDGSAWISGGEQYHRVLRGGSWVWDADLLRSANRVRKAPDVPGFDVGFRLAAFART